MMTLTTNSARTKIEVQTRLAGRCSRRRRAGVRDPAAKRRSVQMMKGASAPQTYQRGRAAVRLISEIPSEARTEKKRPTSVQRQNPSSSLTQRERGPDVPDLLVIISVPSISVVAA